MKGLQLGTQIAQLGQQQRPQAPPMAAHPMMGQGMPQGMPSGVVPGTGAMAPPMAQGGQMPFGGGMQGGAGQQINPQLLAQLMARQRGGLMGQ
jgi:hypothetical protein